jgi:hypothetical protein
LQEWLEDTTVQVRAIDLESRSSGYHARPVRGRACRYLTDCKRIGRRSCRWAQRKARLKLFEIYFLHNREFRYAIELAGVAQGTFGSSMQ